MSRFAAISLGRAWDIIDEACSSLLKASPTLRSIEPAGDVRRVDAQIGSIVLIGVADRPDAAVAALLKNRDFTRTSVLASVDLPAGLSRACVSTELRGSLVEAAVVTPQERGSALFYATGSPAHVAAVRARGLNDLPFATEEALYASVGLSYVPPELRHGLDEVNRAAAGPQPALVDVADIRGDLHMHTTYSDGRDSLFTMVEAAAALGYDFVAITDHSEGASASRTLGVDEIQQQKDDIAEAAAAFPDVAILHGVEVDILPTGRLDLKDHVLEQFDVVLASLHERAQQSPERLTARSLDAIRHPLVNVLCHPANQLPGATRGYALDFEALYAAAAETGTALEIDGSPSHMDLDDRRARAAAAAGVTLAVDSDCHRAAVLGRQMRFGVGIARRAGIQPKQVLNTRSVAEIRAFVAAKRRGGRAPAPPAG